MKKAKEKEAKMSLPYTYSKDKNWIYEEDGSDIRYVLGETGDKMIICIGINPSTAVPNNLDKTLKNVKKIAEHNGYTGWVMFNVYPKRDTKPQDLPEVVKPIWHEKNLEVIKNVLENIPELNIWCAWGTPIEEREYLKDCLKDFYGLFKNKKVNWLCTGQTKDDNPRHPSRISCQSKLKEFKIEEYI